VSGIVGVWNLDGRPVEPGSLDKLMAPIGHRGPDGLHWWSEGPVALGCAQFRVTPEAKNEVMPLVGRRGAILTWDGRLDNRAELVSLLRGSSPDIDLSCPDPVLVMAAYERWGADFPTRLLGDMALALLDRERRELLLVRDSIPVRPLHWFRTRDTVVFGSEIKALLAHPKAPCRPNRGALAQHFLHGIPRADEDYATFFEDIYSVPAGGVVIFDSNRTIQRKYWDFDKGATVRRSSFPAYVEEFRYHFDRAVSRRLRSEGPVAVSVSGGLDSSAVFCSALATSSSPDLFGFSLIGERGGPADEVRFVVDVERRYGVDVARVPLVPEGPLVRAIQGVWMSDSPVVNFPWFPMPQLYEQVKMQRVPSLLTGSFGDEALFGRAYLADLVDRLEWRRALAHFREHSRWFTDADPSNFSMRTFLGELVREHVPAVAMPALRRTRFILGRPPPANPWWSASLRMLAASGPAKRYPARRGFSSLHARDFYRMMRCQGTYARFERENKIAAGHGVEISTPFQDRDLLSFMMAIPGDVQGHNGVPKALLREGLKDVLPESVALRRWKADFGDPVLTGMLDGWPQTVRRVKGGSAVSAGLVDGEVLSGQLPGFRSRVEGGDFQAVRAVTETLGLELWLEQFFGSTR
jgi:asparagine synthase (glutamine-hydrolysing)